MRKYSLIFLLAIGSMLSLAFINSDFTIGKKAPKSSIKMKNIDGASYSLNDLKQKNGLIVIFSSHLCPFVVGGNGFAGWENQYNDLYTFANNSGFGLVLINSNEANRNDKESLGAMKTHAENNGYKMKYLVDESSELANAFNARTTPHVFLLDKDLKLIYQGPIDNAHESGKKEIKYLRNAVSYHIKNVKITEPTVAPVGCSIKRTKQK